MDASVSEFKNKKMMELDEFAIRLEAHGNVLTEKIAFSSVLNVRKVWSDTE